MHADARAPGAPVSHLLYLHGFRSSPRSTKARMTHAWVQAHRPDLHWWCPQLPPSPREPMALVREGIRGWPADSAAVLGSSLGGFYATVLAERTGWRALVMNPAVDPARDLAQYIGEQTAFHSPQERFFFRAEYVDELRSMTPGPLQAPGRYAAVIAKGDELLDWREMSAHYPGATVRRPNASVSRVRISSGSLIRYVNCPRYPATVSGESPSEAATSGVPGVANGATATGPSTSAASAGAAGSRMRNAEPAPGEDDVEVALGRQLVDAGEDLVAPRAIQRCQFQR